LVRDRPDAFRGQWHAARIERAEGKPQAALEAYDRAFRLWPYREGLVNELASFASGQGRAGYARSIAMFGARRWPGNVNFHRMASGNSLHLGDTVTALGTLRRGLQLHPADSVLIMMWRAAVPGTEP
jgi:tetratricopeptide (TPR) repeat protein